MPGETAFRPCKETTRLRCSTCGSAELLGFVGSCPSCGGILECVYPTEALLCLRESSTGKGLSHYRRCLPVEGPLVSLGEGGTPLIRARNLAEEIGLADLYLKNESINPTGSFKDRGAAVAVTRALADGTRGVLTASTGNAAAAVAAYCASQRIPCLVLLNSGSPVGKLRQALAYGACCIQVEGLFERESGALIALLTDLSKRLELSLAFFWAPVNPYLIEGMKTIAYETVAQLGGQAPDVVVCPVGGGDGLAGQWRGYQELQRAGIIDRLPRMIGVQSRGAAPLVLSFQKGVDRVLHIEEAHTVASGLQVTFSGDHALRAIRDSGGVAMAVDDDVILRHQRLLARLEGVWTEPSGAIGVAAVSALLQAGLIDSEERIVCVLTGAGFKDRHHDGASANSSEVAMPLVGFDLEQIEARVRLVLDTSKGEWRH